MNNSYIGAVATVIATDTYTQAVPGKNQPGLMYLSEGTSWKVTGQSVDGGYVDLGFNQWVSLVKLRINY